MSVSEKHTRHEGPGDRRLLLTGATSQIAQCLLDPLLQAGFRIEAWSRQQPAHSNPDINWQQRDLSQDHSWVAPPSSTLIHLAPLWLLPELLRRAAPAGKLRLIAISSCSVTAKANSPSAEERALAARLQRAETELHALAETQGHQLTILRPTMIYGLGRDSNVSQMQRFIQRWHFLPMPALRFGLRQPVHAEDVAAAVLACLQAPASIGQTYEIGGAERLTLNRIAQRLFLDNQLPVRIFKIPAWILASLLRLRAALSSREQLNPALLERARLDQIADNSAAERDFGYRPRDFDGRFPTRPTTP